MARAAAFDSETIELLQTEFVPFAGDRHVVSGRPSPLRDWFHPMAESVNPRVARGETAQGFYVAGADGTGYGWTQSGNATTTLDFLHGGLQKFRENPPQTVTIVDSDADETLTPSADTTVIRVYSWAPDESSRVESDGPRAIGRDQLWIYANEVRQIVAASEDGFRTVEFPLTLVARMARFHLIDTSGGRWGGRWSETEVEQAEIDATITHQDGDRRTISFDGRFAMRSHDGRDGFEGTIEGDFDVDVSTGELIQFRAYGEGHGWGEHGWPRVHEPTDEYPCEARPRFPLVFAMLQATDEVARTVPPVGLLHGAPYAEPTISTNPR